MAIRIFENPDTDGDGGSQVDDIVGRFRAGYQASNRPVALSEWRVTTSDPDVAERLVDVLDASEGFDEWDTQTDEVYQVFGGRQSVDILLDGPGSVRSSMVLWGRKGKIRECDGVYLLEDGKPTDEPCPSCSTLNSTAELKAAANKGTGCEPSLQAYFRLAEAPELGKFKFFSSAWTARDIFNKAEEKLAKIDGPAKGKLELELVEWTDKTTGEYRSYTRPKLTVAGAVEEEEG